MPLGPLLVGYSADVEVILEVRDNALRIPTAALGEGGRVLLVDDDRLVERAVKPGFQIGSRPRCSKASSLAIAS